jgi:hypothetical protein
VGEGAGEAVEAGVAVGAAVAVDAGVAVEAGVAVGAGVEVGITVGIGVNVGAAGGGMGLQAAASTTSNTGPILNSFINFSRRL